jgi:hypothetical protein
MYQPNDDPTRSVPDRPRRVPRTVSRHGDRDPRRALRSIFCTVAAVAAVVVALLAATSAQAAAGHDPIGNVDALSVVNGAVQATGWAYDPDNTASLVVWMTVDGVRTAAILAHDPRPDVSAIYPAAGPHRGFTVRFAMSSGTHLVCAVAMNLGSGANRTLRCGALSVDNNPRGSVDSVRLAPGGVQVIGWALDPNTPSPIRIMVYVDGAPVGLTYATQPRPDVASVFPYYGPGHGFVGLVPVKDGSHVVCVSALNAGLGANATVGCRAIATTHHPVGAFQSATNGRIGGTSNWVSVGGWALDADSYGAVQVQIQVDGVPSVTAPADRTAAAMSAGYSPTPATYPLYGQARGYLASLNLDANQHHICAVALNVGAGASVTLGCLDIQTTGALRPAAPTGVQVWPGNGSIDLSWNPAVSTSTPVTGYTIVTSPGGRRLTTAGTATRVTVPGLVNGAHYAFTLTATNALGTGSAATATGVPAVIPPQFTAAPVSTSHYLRNLTGQAITDSSIARAMGVADALHNPSNHRYLILLQVGGQDESRQGVILSATSTFVSYPAVVTAVKAYVDGYHSAQRIYAPATIALGTNNDIDVTMNAGISWAANIVKPVAAYTAARYPSIQVAGANDIEPGFSATFAQSRLWLIGYLNSTSAPFVFNGSADGCSTVAAGSNCNNGWRMSDLQWLSGGAAPGRIINLPQIYNYAMPLQWKLISLTGVALGRARLYFGGPLTEYTACVQARSCGSITNVDAWNRLWAAISSNALTKQYDMPHGTDLRIN